MVGKLAVELCDELLVEMHKPIPVLDTATKLDAGMVMILVFRSRLAEGMGEGMLYSSTAIDLTDRCCNVNKFAFTACKNCCWDELYDFCLSPMLDSGSSKGDWTVDFLLLLLINILEALSVVVVVVLGVIIRME